MKTQYEQKVEEIKNRPTLLLYHEDGGLLNESVESTRETFPLHYKVFRQISQRARKAGL